MKAVVSLSGGMDSATVLAEALGCDREVLAVGFRYGSKHNTHEERMARTLAAHYEVPFELIDLSAVMVGFKSNLMKGGGEVPEGHYEAESMRQTVVPARNIIFASVLAGYAWSNGAEEVWLGIHAGDHYIYPDCRPKFFHAMHEAVVEGTGGKVRLIAPFLTHNKAQILKYGMSLGVPYQHTRTCYQDRIVACGKCGSCQERLEAFERAEAEDPLEYESRVLIPR